MALQGVRTGRQAGRRAGRQARLAGRRHAKARCAGRRRPPAQRKRGRLAHASQRRHSRPPAALPLLSTSARRAPTWSPVWNQPPANASSLALGLSLYPAVTLGPRMHTSPTCSGESVGASGGGQGGMAGRVRSARPATPAGLPAGRARAPRHHTWPGGSTLHCSSRMATCGRQRCEGGRAPDGRERLPTLAWRRLPASACRCTRSHTSASLLSPSCSPAPGTRPAAPAPSPAPCPPCPAAARRAWAEGWRSSGGWPRSWRRPAGMRQGRQGGHEVKGAAVAEVRGRLVAGLSHGAGLRERGRRDAGAAAGTRGAQQQAGCPAPPSH